MTVKSTAENLEGMFSSAVLRNVLSKRCTLLGCLQDGRAVFRCGCARGLLLVCRPALLHRGLVPNCGCTPPVGISQAHHRPGMYRSLTYEAWKNMIGNAKQRGIPVVDSWYNFHMFLSDMKKRPKGLGLERIDKKRGFGPLNCLWC